MAEKTLRGCASEGCVVMMAKVYVPTSLIEVFMSCMEKAIKGKAARWVKKPQVANPSTLPEYKKGHKETLFLSEIDIFDEDRGENAGVVAMLLHITGIMPILPNVEKAMTVDPSPHDFFYAQMMTYCTSFENINQRLDLEKYIPNLMANGCNVGGADKASSHRVLDRMQMREIIIYALTKAFKDDPDFNNDFIPEFRRIESPIAE